MSETQQEIDKQILIHTKLATVEALLSTMQKNMDRVEELYTRQLDRVETNLAHHAGNEEKIFREFHNSIEDLHQCIEDFKHTSVEQTDKKLEPIKADIQKVKGAWWIIAKVGAIVVGLFAVGHYLGLF